jgi:hypothetical protein
MAATPRWAVVDELVHELGSLRAVVVEAESRPELADDDVTLELRASLGRAADTIHLVIGGDESMVSKAWRCITEAKEVSARARRAVERSRATQKDTSALRARSRAHVVEAKRHIEDLRDLEATQRSRRNGKAGRSAKA